jgi:uncharacterized membrane protein
MIFLKNWHEQERHLRSFGDRLADSITGFVGSWLFIIIHIIWFGVWIIIPVEPFPFGLLTMIVSLEAILLATFIMMSQNRQSDRDRVQAEADYQTDVAAKQEIEELQIRLARIEDEKLDQIFKILEEIKSK